MAKAPASHAVAPDLAVRRAAIALGDAVRAARAAGYVVDLPFADSALGRIAISETGAVGRRPAPLPGQPRAATPEVPEVAADP